MVLDLGPGYKANNNPNIQLNEQVRMVLLKRIKELGRQPWGFKLNLPTFKVVDCLFNATLFCFVDTKICL